MNSARGFTCTGVIGVLLLSAWSTHVHADSPDPQWRLSFPIYLSGGAYYQKSGGESTALESLAATAELELSSPARPYSASFFVNYEISPDSRHNGTVNVGGQFEYRYKHWDATTYLFAHNTRDGPSQWLYGGRVRYRLAENHKVGIETMAAFEDPASSQLMVGYYGTISRTISVKIVAGATINAHEELVARTVFVWQIR